MTYDEYEKSMKEWYSKEKADGREIFEFIKKYNLSAGEARALLKDLKKTISHREEKGTDMSTTVESFNLRRLAAMYHLQQALLSGGYEVMSMKIVRDPNTDEEIVVVKFFDGHEKRANIHGDSIGSALYDVLKQIGELRR